MEDLSDYSLDAIYEMIKDGTISVEDLAEYITEVVPDMEPTEDLREFLLVASDYMDRQISSGREISEPVVEEVKEVASDTTPAVETSEVVQAQPTEEKPEPVPVVVPPVSQPQEQPEPVIEDVEVPVEIESPEPVAEEYPFFESDNNSYDEARRAMDNTYTYCQDAGMTIEEISLSGKDGRGPHISFEINNESKQFLDHLMNEFYQSSDGISLEFMRDLSTKSEFFTIEIDPANMSREEFFLHVRDTFDRIYHTIETTRRDFDYESAMPDGLRQIKDRFTNDDPDIGQDFTIGYIRSEGQDSYYLVADDSQTAIEYARSIGYDIKSRPGSNIYEIDTNGSMIDTKLETAAVALETEEEVYDIEQNGVADLDIYGDLQQDPRVELIENFIETSNDPHIMCVLEIEVPPENTNQRIVKMKTEMGGSDTVVFTDGEEFDNKVFPKIIDTYADNNPISKENISVSSADALDRASYQVESENNTTMVVNGYSEIEVNKMVASIESKADEYGTSQDLEKSNVRQKTIGTYPTNNNQTENNAFVSMPVLFVICILFILMLSLIIFAG